MVTPQARRCGLCVCVFHAEADAEASGKGQGAAEGSGNGLAPEKRQQQRTLAIPKVDPAGLLSAKEALASQHRCELKFQRDVALDPKIHHIHSTLGPYKGSERGRRSAMAVKGRRLGKRGITGAAAA